MTIKLAPNGIPFLEDSNLDAMHEQVRDRQIQHMIDNIKPKCRRKTISIALTIDSGLTNNMVIDMVRTSLERSNLNNDIWNLNIKQLLVIVEEEIDAK
jgi:hypothetical protein